MLERVGRPGPRPESAAPTRTPRPALPSAGFDVEDLAAMLGDIEQGRAGVPVLLRQYLRLGGKLLGFNVDREVRERARRPDPGGPHAGRSPNCSIAISGRDAARHFLEFQKGMYGTHESIRIGRVGRCARSWR